MLHLICLLLLKRLVQEGGVLLLKRLVQEGDVAGADAMQKKLPNYLGELLRQS